MCDREFQPFYVNAAGMRLVGLDDLDAARRVKVQDYFLSCVGTLIVTAASTTTAPDASLTVPPIPATGAYAAAE